MPNKITIRSAKLPDATTIAEFNIRMAKETEGIKLDSDIVHKGVTHLIENPKNGFYLVADKQGDILGSLMITTEWSDWRNGDFWWIQSVYVKPEGRRQGIYSYLYKEVQNMAKSQGDVCGIRLYVEQNNLSAQKAYESLGMKASHYKVYQADL
jgi:ribosomal protein S18 acetylase RimI-like enzyme